MSKNELYFLLFMLSLNLDGVHRKIAHASVIFHNGYEYVDAMNNDVSYQDNNDVIEPDQSYGRVEADETKYHAEPPNAPDRRDASDLDPREESALLCMPKTPEQQEAVNAAVKEAQDTIDHVTNLIRSMREHAIGIVKDANELETDLLVSCDGGDNTNNACNNNDSNGNKKVCEPSGNNNNENKKPCPTNSGNNNCVNSESNTNSKKLNPNAKHRPYMMNEWAVPIKTKVSRMDGSNEFMKQAQDAVKAWREQIDACKRILDSATQAAQHQGGITNFTVASTVRTPAIDEYAEVFDNAADFSSADATLLSSGEIGNVDTFAICEKTENENSKLCGHEVTAPPNCNGKDTNNKNWCGTNNNHNTNDSTDNCNGNNKNDNNNGSNDNCSDNNKKHNNESNDNCGGKNKNPNNDNNDICGGNNNNNCNEAKSKQKKVKDLRKRKFSGHYDLLRSKGAKILGGNI